MENSVNNESIIEPTPNERKVSNIFDIHEQLLNVQKRYAPGFSPILAADITNRNGINAEFQAFYERADALRRVAKRHSWTRATVSSVARAAIGAGFAFTRHPVYGQNLKITAEQAYRQLLPVYDFFYGTHDEDKYIQDMLTLPSKIYYSVVSLVYYGQVAWEILYDDNDIPIGFDVLAGIVRPNVNQKGRFQRPAYYFRPWNSTEIITYSKPRDLLYVTWPGVDLNIFGSSEYESLADISIPSDIYASTAYRNHFENINAPYNGVWIVDKETNDDDYRMFLTTLVNRYSGVVNFGRTPVVIRGDVEFKETRSRSNDDAPYLEGRRYNQEEISAVSGVSSAKMGLAANTTKTNFRDQRRDFHENTLRPIFEILETAIYTQIFVRGFGIKEWKMTFNKPDLTTALESATIHNRYIISGVMTPNDVREELGMPRRDDELGDMYYEPSGVVRAVPGQGPDAGNEEAEREPDGGSDRQFDMMRPPTQDRAHTGFEDEDTAANRADDGELKKSIVDELRTWKKFAMRIVSGKRNERKFDRKFINDEVADQIQKVVDSIQTKEEMREFFNELIEEFDNL